MGYFMGKLAVDYEFEEYRNLIDGFAPCMDDYLYYCDLQADRYYISPKALERFALPSNEFTDVIETHKVFVYEEDVDMLVADLKKMVSGEADEHNIEYRWIGKEGQPIWINCRGRALKDRGGKPACLVGCVNEIGARQKADNISGLKEISSVSSTIETFCRVANSGYFLHIGIDEFKAINERFGHEYGNYIIHGVADCITRALSAGQEVYRVVADEFLVVDYLSDNEKSGKELYDKIRKNVDVFIEENHYQSVFTISGGVLSSKEVGEISFDEMLRLSQFALNRAKQLGKNQVYFFVEEDYNSFLRTRLILSAMREAVSSDYEGFEVHYQPIILDSESTVPYSAEALLRYVLPSGERVSPAEFIPILEESGLIIPMGKWILNEAIKFCKKVQEKYPTFRVNVNVSYVQVLKSPFLLDLLRLLKENNMSPASIVVELTESGQLDDSAQIHKVWENLRMYGVNIALDDFGTGYSNLMNISDMTPNVVKLDRGFTVKALSNDFEKELMDNIIKMVHSLGLKICVEGVETEEELLKIRTLSPDFIQGFYFGKPCPDYEFLQKYVK